jgi:uncharacterized repeat protein (TIGR02543 family)
MSKKNKYIIGALVGCAILLFVLYFIFGNKKKEFIIAFDSGGGSVVASQTVTEKDKVKKPVNPTKENYNFVHWEYDNREYDFNKEVTSNMTLKAIWEEIKIEENYYDIEFIVDGKVQKLSLSKITENDLASLGFPEKDGYELVWYVNDQVYNFDEPLTGNMTLTGKYVKVNTFTVKFNSDGGTSVPNQKLKLNETVTEPEAITKYGFIFDGWYLNNAKYDFATPVTKNITLKAKWNEDASVPRYDVTFDSDGGSNVDKQRVIENTTVTEPKTPTKTGYRFLGWYINDTKYDFKTKVTGNLALKARWEKIIQYTVTFNKDNGTQEDTVTVNSGDKVTKPANPTKEGYKFIEWLYNNEAFDFNTPITSDIVLTARYKALAKYTVTFDSDGGSNVQSQTVYEGGKATKPSNPTKDDNDFVEWQLNGTKYDFNKVVTGNITLVAKWKEKAHTYKMIATKADNFSVDSYLKLYKDNKEITYKSFTVGGVTVPSTPSINTERFIKQLAGATTIRVTLYDDSVVTATVEFR